MARRRTGFSLIELTVYSGILMGLMGGLYLLLVAGMRYFRTGEVHQRVLQDASIAVRRLATELTNSHGEHVAVQGPPGSIIFPSADWMLVEPTNPASLAWTVNATTQELEWRKWVCYRQEPADNTLRRTELREGAAPPTGHGTPKSALSLTPPSLATMTSGAAIATDKIVCRGITNVTFTPNLPVGGTNPVPTTVTIALTATESTGSRTVAGKNVQITEVRLETTVRMENTVIR